MIYAQLQTRRTAVMQRICELEHAVARPTVGMHRIETYGNARRYGLRARNYRTEICSRFSAVYHLRAAAAFSQSLVFAAVTEQISGNFIAVITGTLTAADRHIAVAAHRFPIRRDSHVTEYAYVRAQYSARSEIVPTARRAVCIALYLISRRQYEFIVRHYVGNVAVGYSHSLGEFDRYFRRFREYGLKRHIAVNARFGGDRRFAVYRPMQERFARIVGYLIDSRQFEQVESGVFRLVLVGYRKAFGKIERHFCGHAVYRVFDSLNNAQVKTV